MTEKTKEGSHFLSSKVDISAPEMPRDFVLVPTKSERDSLVSNIGPILQ